MTFGARPTGRQCDTGVLREERQSRRISTAARLAVAAGLVVAASGCGSSSNRYLANKEERVFLKVPRDWSVIDYDSSDSDPLQDATSQVTVVWRSGATPDRAAEPGSVDENEPFAFMAIYELSGELNQRMSASLARVAASPLGFDPLLPQDDTQGELVEVLSYEPLGFDGINGSRIVFRSREAADEDWSATYDISAAYDSKAFRLYVLQVGCNAECFSANEDAISRVAGSWLVTP